MSIPSFEPLSAFVLQEFWKFMPPKRHTDTSRITFLIKHYTELDLIDARLDRIKKQRVFDSKLKFGSLSPYEVYLHNFKRKRQRRPPNLFSNHSVAFPSMQSAFWE